jgi:DNA-binding MarR family transcriptional regulator
MGEFFIKYRPFQGLDNIECLLMSWIDGLHKSNKPVCFTNRYAGFVLGVSESTITRSLKKLSTNGYITTYQPFGDKRFIKLVELPSIRNFSDEVCELELPEDRVVNMTTGGSQNDERYSQNDETGSHTDEGGVVRLTSNKIEHKIEDKIVVSECEHTHPLYPKPFLEIVEKYKDKNDRLDYTYERWKELNPTEQKVAFDSVDLYFVYLSRYGKTKKHLQYYLQDKVFNWDGLDKMKQSKNKITPTKMTDEEKVAWTMEQIKKQKQKQI